MPLVKPVQHLLACAAVHWDGVLPAGVALATVKVAMSAMVCRNFIMID